jgi:CheY-like chemotaxis protein
VTIKVTPYHNFASSPIDTHQEPWSDNQKLHFVISDTGPGIDDSIITKVFEPFVKGNRSSGDKSGTGLGLTISRSFVRLMGGDLRAANQPGGGTRIDFDINIEDVDAPKEEQPRGRQKVHGLAPGQDARRILVVDDNDLSRSLLTKLLEIVGMQIHQAGDGHQALEAFHQWNPDLVFMDIRMPGMDGLEATRAIKATSKGKEIPVIAVTAQAFEEDRRQALDAGCNGFIRKPYKEYEVYDALSSHLGVVFEYGPPTTTETALNSADEPTVDLQSVELPPQLITELRTAALLLDVQHVNACVDKITSHDRVIGKHLQQLSDKFRFDKILEAIPPAKSEPFSKR